MHMIELYIKANKLKLIIYRKKLIFIYVFNLIFLFFELILIILKKNLFLS